MKDNNLKYSNLDLKDIYNNLVDNLVREYTTNINRNSQLEYLYLELLKRGRIDVYKDACKQTAAIIFETLDKAKSILKPNVSNLRQFNYHQNVPSNDFLPETTLLLENDNLRIATISGDSMIDAGIYDGDDIIIELTSNIKDNDIVVFKFDEQLIVKRYIYKDGEYWFKPENEKYDSVKITKSLDYEIIGKVKSVIHRF